MKTLATQFIRNGWRHRQIERIGFVAIYERSKPEISRPHYEVVKIRECAARVMPNGQTIPSAEVYPSSERWGDLGWTHNEIHSARKQFLQLVREAEAKAAVPA